MSSAIRHTAYIACMGCPANRKGRISGGSGICLIGCQFDCRGHGSLHMLRGAPGSRRMCWLIDVVWFTMDLSSERASLSSSTENLIA